MESAQPTRGQWIALGLVLVLGLGLRALHLANHRAGPLGRVEEVFEASDMHAFTEWSAALAAGDWLDRGGYHAYPEWMHAIAPLEEFEAWWGGRAVFHQAPLYAYLLALSRTLTGGNLPVLVLQVLGGTASLLLLFLLGRRLLDVRAGLAAAGIGAVFAPAIVLDAVQLRASLGLTSTLLSVWLLLWLRDGGGRGRGALTGAVLAAGFLLRPTGLLLLVLGPLLLLASRAMRERWRCWLPALSGAALLVLAPLFVRNLAVGAPALSFSTRGPETIVHSNSAAADPGFMTILPAEDYRALMVEGHGSALAALRASIGSWPDDGELSWWLWHQGQKALCVLGDHEYANNVNFYYYRALTPGLELLPTFGWFAGLALVGVVLLARFGRDRAALWIPLVALVGLLSACHLGFALGRYRMPVAMLLTLPAGAALSLVVRWARERRLAAVGATCACALALSVASFALRPATTLPGPDGELVVQPRAQRSLQLASARLRSHEHLQAARILFERGDSVEAIARVDAYRSTVLDHLSEHEEHFEEDGDVASLRVLLRTAAGTLDQVATLYHGWNERRRANETKALVLRLEERAVSLEAS
jgi:4-amino-4-deoxy-L-arabinose transferase-like glycosyltransferase